MAKLCEMKVSGKTTGTVVVSNAILRGKVTRPVGFNTIAQVKGAITLEKSGLIRIHGEFPDNVIEKLNQKGNNPYARQTFHSETDAPPADAVSVKMQTPSTKKPEIDEDAQPKGDFPTPSTKNDQEEPDYTKDEQGAPAFEVPPTDPPENEVPVGSTRSDIVEMTAKELKSHIKENEIAIEGVSKMNATQLKNALLSHYEMDELTEEEAN